MTIMFSSDTICYFNAGSSDTAELLGNYLSKILIKNGFQISHLSFYASEVTV